MKLEKLCVCVFKDKYEISTRINSNILSYITKYEKNYFLNILSNF